MSRRQGAGDKGLREQGLREKAIRKAPRFLGQAYANRPTARGLRKRPAERGPRPRDQFDEFKHWMIWQL